MSSKLSIVEIEDIQYVFCYERLWHMIISRLLFIVLQTIFIGSKYVCTGTHLCNLTHTGLTNSNYKKTY